MTDLFIQSPNRFFAGVMRSLGAGPARFGDPSDAPGFRMLEERNGDAWGSSFCRSLTSEDSGSEIMATGISIGSQGTGNLVW